MKDNTDHLEVGVAHVSMPTDRMEDSTQFMLKTGMRLVFEGPQISVLEMRGGTHLIIMLKDHVEASAANFDLMVDDLHATHEKFTVLGLNPSVIEGRPAIDHEVFTLREPAGNEITFYSSHLTFGTRVSSAEE